MTGLSEHLATLADALTSLQDERDRLERWGITLATELPYGARLLVAGNGGSAAEAQHLTAELVGRFQDERQPLSAICLSAETSSLTAILNDYGAEEVFARQVRAHGRQGDVLVLLSTSGRSPNVLEAARAGRDLGLTVWAMTGPGPNPLADLADEALCVASASTSAVQEVHLIAVHAVCAALDAELGRQGIEPAPRQRTVVVIGDVLLDRDVHGRVDRIAPDAPVPVLDVQKVRESPGGAGLTALLCAEPDVQVRLIAPIADDEAGNRLRDQLQERVEVVALPHRGATRTKTRLRSAGQSLLRLDDGGPGTPDGPDLAAVRAALTGADVVLVCDYGAGTTTDPGLRTLLAEFAATTTMVWDPHPRGGSPVPKVTLVTPNLSEARAVLSDGADPDLAAELSGHWLSRAVCVTAGSAGAYLAIPGSETMFVPAPAVHAGDPCGAGDRFAASAAVALARGAVLSQAVVTAVRDASAWVGSGGASGFRDRDPATSSPVPARPVTANVDELLTRVRSTGGRVVATGGCFDVLHIGHVTSLAAARQAGDALVVLLNSDDSVRRLKGPGRPVVPAPERARVLQALESVDGVIIFDEDDPRAALDRLRPDIWVKGGDYGGAELPEAPLVRSWGGRVLLLPYVDGRSSTTLLNRLSQPDDLDPLSPVPDLTPQEIL
jgi:D-beta-D-heptose 7-phosphate kinase/D-beta-D-heptose 1-phosphate adenosyltransferase